MGESNRLLLMGNDAVARAAVDAGVALGTGYPGTPATEILEEFARLGGTSQWAPNEKVAFEVGIGVAYAGARALVSMKHVGVNVASDPLFTAAYTGVTGALVLVSADDPEMHSSQNEQDNRNYSRAAGIPTLEPSDAQEAYDFFLKAVEISERWGTPVMLRMTTRVCHSKGIVQPSGKIAGPGKPHFEHDIAARLMVPGYARPAHRKLRKKLAEIKDWNEASGPNQVFEGGTELGIITSGVSFLHAREAAPDASICKIGMCYPFPDEFVRAFAKKVKRCVVIEEGDPYLVEYCRYFGIAVEGKPEMYRFGELNVGRVKRILAGDTSVEPVYPPGNPPKLCSDCPHRTVSGVMADQQLIVAGDIGCYTLGGLKPLEAMDSCVCMGASIGVGLGLRHALPREEAKKVVSVIGDSTFVHSGITGLVDMAYNPPPTGHVVVIVDNGTTAMTGLQEHPGTGRTLAHKATRKLSFEELGKAVGLDKVHVIDPVANKELFETTLKESLESEELVLIIARRLCSLGAPKLEAYERATGRQGSA